MSNGWSRVDDIIATLRKRWDRSVYLRSYAAREPWSPITIPVKAPTAADLAERLDDVVRWNDRFRRDSCTAAGRPRFGIEYRTISGRGFGANQVPSRIRIDTLDQLVALLGTQQDLQAFDQVLSLTELDAPALRSWVTAHPLLAIQHANDWSKVLATVNWIVNHDTTTMYLRHIDIAGVDTKFIERHQQLLGQLLTTTLPPDRIDPSKTGFAARYGFKTPPGHTRFRLLSPNTVLPAGISEVHLRTEELAQLDLDVSRVFIVENLASYLAFPNVSDSIVIFGEGFKLATLEAVPWLADAELIYWGDIDTHGFAILNQLRARFPHVTSILMDEATLLDHRTQFVTEPNPTRAAQPHLTEAEQALYRDLIEDRFGPSVRLEQERIRFSAIRRSFEKGTHPRTSTGDERSTDDR